MTAQVALIAWITLGALTAAADAVMGHRRLSGKLGEDVRARYRRAGARLGGARNLYIIAAVVDLCLWPFGLANCLLAWRRDRRTHQAELARAD